MSKLWVRRFAGLCFWSAALLLVFFLVWATLFALHVVTEPPPRPYPVPISVILGLVLSGLFVWIAAAFVNSSNRSDKNSGKGDENPK